MSEFQGQTKRTGNARADFLKRHGNAQLRVGCERCLSRPNLDCLVQHDAVPMEDVRISIIYRRLASMEDASVEKEELKRELAQLLNV